MTDEETDVELLYYDSDYDSSEEDPPERRPWEWVVKDTACCEKCADDRKRGFFGTVAGVTLGILIAVIKSRFK